MNKNNLIEFEEDECQNIVNRFYQPVTSSILAVAVSLDHWNTKNQIKGERNHDSTN